MQKLVDVSVKSIWDVLSVLFEDKTTGKNVVWATDAYASRGPGFGPEDQITKDAFIGDDPVLIQPRIEKDAQEQQARTKKKAEVYTPSWLCNKMNNYCDEEWFGRPKVFNEENGGGAWTARKEPIWFNQKKGRKTKEWQKYVDSRRLEITCGEAPFLVSRYDAATGDILPIDQRIGILDRKLRVVNENTASETEWLKWAQRAVESCYGYEYQGDSLLIARINVLMTFCEYYKSRWKKEPVKRVLKTVANIVAWNIWQMDGINDATPLTRIVRKRPSFPLIEEYDPEFLIEEPSEEIVGTLSKINNWRSKYSFVFNKLKETGVMKKKMFDFVIGNPPYQETTESDSSRMPPVYNFFMEEAYKIGNGVELITPARFLFNTGYTPKTWNTKMLNDEHFTVLKYEPSAESIFPNTEIKGGVIISYRDERVKFGAIETFTKYIELNTILKKVKRRTSTFLDDIIYPSLNYEVSELMKKENPELLGRLRTSAFTNLKKIFFEEPEEPSGNFIAMVGLLNSKRTVRFVRRDYIRDKSGIVDKYNLLLPESNGSGTLGEMLAPSMVAKPGTAYTQTFIGIGAFDTEKETKAAEKYIKTKFARAMLGVKKATQHNPRPTWAYVPLQDFTSKSEIDWTKSIAEIDQQLYKKYELSEEEIEFIETHVKEMQ